MYMHPQDQAEEFGDGYTNDAQRAHAHSQMTTPRPDYLPEARILVARGWYVLVCEYSVFCRATDGILGGATCIVARSTDRATLEQLAANEHEACRGEESFYVLPRVVDDPLTPLNPHINDDADEQVPF